uniref:Platelet glycoprotein V-like n=1 Tax=Oryzias melastigma TaxID=30732 RepID=A0A3B3C4F2_ORYME
MLFKTIFYDILQYFLRNRWFSPKCSLWTTLLFLTFPPLHSNPACPTSCLCDSPGELNDTNMNIIKEQSLAHQDLLLPFLAAPQLKSVKLSSNDLSTELPPDVFCCLPHLQKLSLRNNNLDNLHPHIFSSLTAVNILLLNDNSLRSLPGDIFQNLTNLTAMDLRNNNLKSLPGDIFSSNTALKALTLSENPWDCNCPIRDIARWIRNNPHVVVDIDDVTTQTPLYEPEKTTHESTTSYSTPRMHTSLQPMDVIPTTPLSKTTSSGATTRSMQNLMKQKNNLTANHRACTTFYDTYHFFFLNIEIIKCHFNLNFLCIIKKVS